MESSGDEGVMGLVIVFMIIFFWAWVMNTAGPNTSMILY